MGSCPLSRARHDVRGHGGDERRREHGRREVPLHLLEHEDQAGERRVERGREPGAGAGGDERLPLPRGAAKPSAHGLAECAAHLDGGALAAQRQAAADPDDAADELDGEDARGPHGPEVVQHGLQVRDAAPGRLRRHGADQPDGDAGAGRAEQDRDRDSPARVAVRVLDEIGAQSVRRRQDAREGHGHQAGDEPEHDGAGKLPPPLLVRAQEAAHLAPHELRDGLVGWLLIGCRDVRLGWMLGHERVRRSANGSVAPTAHGRCHESVTFARRRNPAAEFHGEEVDTEHGIRNLVIGIEAVFAR